MAVANGVFFCLLASFSRHSRPEDYAQPAMPSDVEVLVIGTGPSGLMLAQALNGAWPYISRGDSSDKNAPPATTLDEGTRIGGKVDFGVKYKSAVEREKQDVSLLAAPTPTPRLPLLMQQLPTFLENVGGENAASRPGRAVATLFDRLWKPGLASSCFTYQCLRYPETYYGWLKKSEVGAGNTTRDLHPASSQQHIQAVDATNEMARNADDRPFPMCHVPPKATLRYTHPDKVPHRRFRHLLVGAEDKVGGSWQGMRPGLISLSPGEWMSLPGPYTLQQHMQSLGFGAGRYTQARAQEHEKGGISSNTTRSDPQHPPHPDHPLPASNLPALDGCGRVPRWVVSTYYEEFARYKKTRKKQTKKQTTKQTTNPPPALLRELKSKEGGSHAQYPAGLDGHGARAHWAR
jgi:hypothetical protein